MLIISSLTYHYTDNKILAAYAGTLGENIGFYGTIIVRDVLEAKRNAESWNWKHVVPVLRNILIEFGVAELLDTLVFRPMILWGCTIVFTNYQLGALVGVILADIIFYSLAVLSSELTRKYRVKNK